MKRLAVLILGVGLAASSALAETRITIGVYNFPPIARVDQDNRAAGLLGDLLQAIEKHQDQVSFEVFHTSPRRRHMDMEAGLYDVIFFENASWGWEALPVEATPPILKEEEVYVALDKPGRDNSFFDDISQRRIIAIAGYHYGFANYETDSGKLEQRFDIEFSDSHSRSLELIKADRPSVAEVAVVGRAYLRQHFKKHPEDRSRLMVSEDTDQTYHLQVIVRKDAPVNVDDIAQLLAPLIDNGTYPALVEKWGLELPDELPETLTGTH